MDNKEALDHAIESLNTISESLNTALVDLLGEAADWENHAGAERIPACYLSLPSSQQNQLLAKAWAAREEANSSIAWIEDHLED